MGTLYIVATPIGNLDDFSVRALDTLRAVSLILAEDTRVTAKLLQAKDISTPMRSYHQHSTEKVVTDVIERLEAGDDIALVSDAGTPGINDPGGRLVSDVLAATNEVRVVPVPGPNAAVTALSASGFPAERFSYLGFVPHKKGRETFFRNITERKETQVFYESKHRIVRALEQLRGAFDEIGQAERPVVVAREITKQFETFYRGSVSEVLTALNQGESRGEFVVIVGPYKQ
jgi:16S rRNA (cytidine1402-2'-O)-methyltransferase